MFTVHGALMYADTQGNATGYDDVFMRIENTARILKTWAWVLTM